MRKTFPKILLGLLVLFIGLQFIRSDQTNPATDPSLSLFSVAAPDARVREILERSCFDCHSNQTVWPWYSQIAPFSWTVSHDVEEGREHLNFSTWAELPVDEKIHKLEELCEEIEAGKMPMGNYLLLHPDGDLSNEEKILLCQWTARERADLSGSAPAGESKEAAKSADEQKENLEKDRKR